MYVTCFLHTNSIHASANAIEVHVQKWQTIHLSVQPSDQRGSDNQECTVSTCMYIAIRCLLFMQNYHLDSH